MKRDQIQTKETKFKTRNKCLSIEKNNLPSVHENTITGWFIIALRQN